MKIFSNRLLFFIFLTSIGVGFLFFNISYAFASTDITDDIQVGTIWTTEGSPYIVKNSISVVLGVTLTIDPGVVVKFDPTARASITVFGDLVVNGTKDNKIYFTSNYDDTVGGDTDGDYSCYPDFDEDGNPLGEVCDGSWLVPSEDDWGGIYFFDSHNNFLKNVVFKYTSSLAYLDHTYLNLKDVEFSNGGFGIFANVSNIDADAFDCTDLADTALYGVSGSNINWINSSLDTIRNDAIYVYDSSILNLSDFSIKNINSKVPLYVFRDSTLNADKLQIENVTGDYNYDMYVFSNSKLILSNSSFKNCPSGACITFFDQPDYLLKPSSINIENSIFDGGAGSAIVSYGDSNISAIVSNSVIKNFSDFAIANYTNKFIINAEDNFWGNSTGPFHSDENPTGTAGSVFDNVDFVPWCKTEKCKVRNPVILIPGIMGTEIFKDYDDQKEIWPNVNKLIFSITDNFLNDLALNTDGTEKSDMPMKLGDIIRGTHLDILGVKYDSKVYEGLINELESNGYVENINLFVFPYDWRKSNADSAEKLKEKINKILADTGADKVDLVAHSMGGLVAKKYIADNGANKIDQLIFIGTPQLGAPKAFKVIMEGDDMGIAKGKYSFLTPSKVKYIVQNMPGVFELLPSKKYIDGQSDFSGNKYITDYITPSFSDPKNPVKPDLSFSQTEDFLKSQKINTKMLDFADNLHNDTDNLDLSGMKVSNFIGCGTTKTIGHITVKKKSTGILFWKKLINTYDLEYENGDDTVPLSSADDSFGNKYYVKGSSHGELPSASGIQELATMILRGKKLIDFPNVSFNKHDCFIKGKTITLYSMLPMMEYLVYDGFGNFTGPVKSIDLKSIQDPTEMENNSEEIEYGIPGVQYNKIGGITSIFLPAGGSYRIIVKNVLAPGGVGGVGGGGNIINSYDLSIGNINADDTSAGSVNFNNVPVNNPDESFQIEISADTFPEETNANVPPVIQVDENGDGTYENEISPTVVLNDVQTNDVSVPTTTSSVVGNTVSLSASDENSGVSNTQYSLDGGDTWANYTVPIEVNVVAGGSDVIIQYFSTDNAGNIEPIQILRISAPPLPPPPLLPSLPTPVVVDNTRHNSGGIVLLSEAKRTDINGVQGLSLGNSDILEKPILNNLKVPDFRRTVIKEAQEPSLVSPQKSVLKGNQGQSLKESQTASAVTSNIKINPIWIFVALILLSIGIFVARKRQKS